MKNRIVRGLLIFLFLFASLMPTVYELSGKDKLQGRTFELVHNYITDYNFYLSRIRQGMEGRWTVVEQYTSEPHQGSLIQEFYLLLGKPVASVKDRVFGATVAYHLARIVLGAILLLLIVFLAQRMFTSFFWQVIAFLSIVTASTIPIVVSLPDNWRLGGYMSWWTVMDSLQRITFLPHILLGQIGIIVLICDVLGEKKSWQLPVRLVTAFITGIVFPPGLLFVGVVYGVESVIELRVSPWRIWLWKKLFPRITVLTAGLPAFFYYTTMLGIYPWRRLVVFDQLHPVHFSFLEYGKAVGLVLFGGIAGSIAAAAAKEKRSIPYVSWIIAWILVLFVFQYIPQQSPLRFTEMAPQIPLGMMTVYLFYTIWRKQSRASTKHMFTRIFFKTFSLTIPFLLIVSGLGVMHSSYLWQKDFINQKQGAGWPVIPMNNIIVYPINEFVEGVRFLERTPKHAVILSGVASGNYIPPYAGRTVYLGHDNTVEKEEKTEIVRQFFTKEMPEDEAYAWLTDNGITHVFFGPVEKEMADDTVFSYPFLTPVYENSAVRIFVVAPVQ